MQEGSERISVSKILSDVKEGRLALEEAELLLKKKPFIDMGFAKIDTQRELRTGAGEVVFGAGKTVDQIREIILTMKNGGQDDILITRLSPDKAEELSDVSAFTYYREGNIGMIGNKKEPDGIGKIAVVTAGTSDIPVAEEAACTSEFFGNETVRLYDVGVAGLHRLLARIDDIMSAKVVIAIAGMEGALASVVGGLCSCPVIAVPTSVGYGASFGGVTALLSMLNSCANGISVVNIDNGYGAAYQASLINHIVSL
ncbi:MAG: nickel pincer cofactor biosynthesis protein LarB [Lachnospiraceae bacterium]|nr:nickel pincer cofactor biosynthesis protein LarB [Lachnospiraceae bacterium]